MDPRKNEPVVRPFLFLKSKGLHFVALYFQSLETRKQHGFRRVGCRMRIQDKLIQLRKEKGLSQRELANLTGIGRRTIERNERNGVPSVPVLGKLAIFYGVTLSTLFKEVDS